MIAYVHDQFPWVAFLGFVAGGMIAMLAVCLYINIKAERAERNPPDPDKLPVMVIEAGQTMYLYPSQVRAGLAVRAVSEGQLTPTTSWSRLEREGVAIVDEWPRWRRSESTLDEAARMATPTPATIKATRERLAVEFPERWGMTADDVARAAETIAAPTGLPPEEHL